MSLAVISAGTLLASVPLVMAGLCGFGAGVGAGDVAVNVDAADVKRITVHGCFSLGTVVGAGAGIAATAARLPAHWHLAAVTLIAAALFLYAMRAVPASIGLGTPGQAGSGGTGSKGRTAGFS
ncbi:hypothetical protein [Nonomuraea jabiensis]|uniref:hypothetical protein n=1 Tax=Nonomuraea jabiensis TaxID=882448 RepID=UPI003D737AA3